MGSLILAFEQLKEKLEKKGYFDQIHKKNIPILPKKIGIARYVIDSDGFVLEMIERIM